MQHIRSYKSVSISRRLLYEGKVVRISTMSRYKVFKISIIRDGWFEKCTYSKIFCIILESCEISSYKLQTIDYDRNSLISVNMNNALKDLVNVTVPNNTKTYTTMISFPKTDVDLSEEIKLNNVSDFISAVGGNLGLFTGFSFLSLLLQMVEWSRNIPISK